MPVAGGDGGDGHRAGKNFFCPTTLRYYPPTPVPTGTFYPPQVSVALKNRNLDGVQSNSTIDYDNHMPDGHGKIEDCEQLTKLIAHNSETANGSQGCFCQNLEGFNG